MIEHSTYAETLGQPKPVPWLHRVTRSLGRLVGGIAVATFVVVLMIVLLTHMPVLGYRTVIITGGSMEPAIHTGSLLLSERTAPEALQIGDIITFRYPESRTTTTHRISGVRDEGNLRLFTTKGDANQTPDAEEISFATGRAYKTKLEVPYAGYALWFLGSPLGIALMVGVPLVALAAMQFLDGTKRRRGVDETAIGD